MRNRNGIGLLVILTSCFVLICVGYISLCHSMADRVGDPDSAEYWQIRTLGLQFRNPEKEAREALNNGEFAVFPAEDIPSDPDSPPRRSNQRIRTATFFAPGSTGPSREQAVTEFERAQTQFANRYNQELARSASR